VVARGLRIGVSWTPHGEISTPSPHVLRGAPARACWSAVRQGPRRLPGGVGAVGRVSVTAAVSALPGLAGGAVAASPVLAGGRGGGWQVARVRR